MLVRIYNILVRFQNIKVRIQNSGEYTRIRIYRSGYRK